MALIIKQKGTFKLTDRLLLMAGDFGKERIKQKLKRYGEEGVLALSSATPVKTGKTADSWDYKIEEDDGVIRLIFTNSNLGDGWAPIAILLQYGHMSKNGTWIEGVDYINPAVKPIFEKIANEAWAEVIGR